MLCVPSLGRRRRKYQHAGVLLMRGAPTGNAAIRDDGNGKQRNHEQALIADVVTFFNHDTDVDLLWKKYLLPNLECFLTIVVI